MAVCDRGCGLGGDRCCFPDGPPPAIADLHALSLHGGVNRVPGFLPGGGTATIVGGWVDNGAHGHQTWMVLGGPTAGRGEGIAVFQASADDPSTGGDTIGASPFDGERVTGDVRFATARIDGKPVSLAIKGVLDWPPSGIIADHATAMIRWYKLVHHAAEGVGPPDVFEIIGTAHTDKRYCNVDLALRDVAGVPLPHDFAGANGSTAALPADVTAPAAGLHGPVKRSITIAGHQTSISLEPVFWTALERAAAERGLPLSALVAQIDVLRIAAPTPPNLASAIRSWLFATVSEKHSQ